VTAIAHVIVRHEQLTGKSLEVKKAGDALGNIVEHAKLIGEVLGELLLAVPSAAVTLAEIREIRIAVARDIQKRPEGLLLVIIEVSVLENALERVLIEAALTVPLIGIILIIEVGKLGILLITVQPSAGGHKILVAAEGVKVKPHASQRAAFIILVIGAAEHGGMAAAVIVLVEIEVNLLKLINDIEIG
jgi:hypothetical protein